MDGLDRIIDEIIREARAQADEILRTANEEAAQILAKGHGEDEKLKQQIEETKAQACSAVAELAAAADRQARRRALLKVRNQMIDDIIAEAKSTIENLPANKYFELLFQLYEKNAQPKDGSICFAPVDYIRIPEGFIERCNQVFPGNTLELFEGTPPDMEDIPNGFMIRYGNILQNCSIDSIFECNEQSFRDKVNDCLELSE